MTNTAEQQTSILMSLGKSKRVDKGLSDIQKSASSATSAILQITDESLKCQKERDSLFDQRKVASTAVDAISFTT